MEQVLLNITRLSPPPLAPECARPLFGDAAVSKIKFSDSPQDPHVHRERIKAVESVQKDAVSHLGSDAGKSQDPLKRLFVIRLTNPVQIFRIARQELRRAPKERSPITEPELPLGLFTRMRDLRGRWKTSEMSH